MKSHEVLLGKGPADLCSPFNGNARSAIPRNGFDCGVAKVNTRVFNDANGCWLSARWWGIGSICALGDLHNTTIWGAPPDSVLFRSLNVPPDYVGRGIDDLGQVSVRSFL
ncbi:hypothetical protein CVT25_002357 [Psilocybe cyanescens]|uniref:Uncharacterized protein n=1 Tax=Psilocybe cyanescens TaxID=93625 RepID=A0A409WKK9_PSICY|nr:hypothetical protein CVT25_002357 [Psilocybe cyanescens]